MRKYIECVTCGMLVLNTFDEIDIHNEEINHEVIRHDINGESID